MDREPIIAAPGTSTPAPPLCALCHEPCTDADRDRETLDLALHTRCLDAINAAPWPSGSELPWEFTAAANDDGESRS